MARKRGRSFIYSLLLLMLLVPLVEGMARLAYWLGRGEGYDPAALLAVEAGPQPEFAPQPADAARTQMLHPYIGTTRSEAGYAINLYPPPRRQAGLMQVALFGGSVAWDVRFALEVALTGAVEARASALGLPPPRVALTVYAKGGMKQPQHLLSLAYEHSLGATFDLAIVLDGFNEMVLPVAENLRFDVFPFFPRIWNLVLTWGATVEQQGLLGRLLTLHEERAALIAEWRDRLLRHSALVGFWLTLRLEDQEDERVALEHALVQSQRERGLERHGPPLPTQDRAVLRPLLLENWATSAATMRLIAESAGTVFVHFLQPNQYVAGSKPLSSEELEIAFEPDSPYGRAATEGYPLLMEAGRQMAAKGLAFVDLTAILIDRDETLYRDECCHFNDPGQEVLAAAMVEHLLAGGWLDRAAGWRATGP